MYIRASASEVEVWTPAKLNLFLEVLSRREDGYHEIETLMTPVSLLDTLYVSSSGQQVGGEGSAIGGERSEVRLAAEVETELPRKDPAPVVFSGEWASGLWKHSVVGKHSGPSHPDFQEEPDNHAIPEGVDNIVVRAVELLRRHAGIDTGATIRSIKIRLVKRIPLAAGLGGGSSDAAAALAAANLAWGLGYSARQLRPLAAELGSDVPFFLAGGPAICRGRGEQVEPVDGLGCVHFVFVRPPQGLTTADVYRACQPARQPRTCAGLIAALRKGRLSEAGRLLHNRLQPAAERLCPWIGRVREEFERLGLAGHQMSGSGTSYFGLCRNRREACRAAARLRGRRVGSVYVVRSCCDVTAEKEDGRGNYRSAHQVGG
jgi:4-diphosphocytidyl-2-C-methyl-D-erythritol kinase